MPKPNDRIRNIVIAVKSAIALALVYLLFRLDIISTDYLLSLLAHPGVVVAAAALTFLAFPLGALRWLWLLRAQDIPIGFFAVFRILCLGNFFNTFLPGGAGGDLVRAAYLMRMTRGMRTCAMTALLADRVFGFFGLLLVAGMFLLAVFGEVSANPKLSTVGTAVAVVVAAAAVAGWAAVRMAAWLRDEKIPADWAAGGGTRGLAYKLLDAISRYRNRAGLVVANLALSAFTHCTTTLAVVVIALALLPDTLSATEFAVATPLSMLAGILPVTPGGIGVGEGAFDQICRLLADKPAVGYGTAFFAFRAIALLLTTPLALVFLFYRYETAGPMASDPDPEPEPVSPKSCH